MVTDNDDLEPVATEEVTGRPDGEDTGGGDGDAVANSEDPGTDVGEPSDHTARRPTFPREPQHLTHELATFKDILEGKTRWGDYLKSKEDLRDARQALRICWKYHPDNDGSNPKAPKRTLGDIDEMREDLMHLSAIAVRLAAIGGAFESAAKAADNERKLARSRAWSTISGKISSGEYGPGKYTVDDKKHAAESSITDFYRTQTELEIIGRILNWVRASVRDMVSTLQVLIQSSTREERKDAKLN